MNKRTDAHRKADKKYREAGKRKIRLGFDVTQAEREAIDAARGEVSLNAYIRSLVIPQKN